MIEPAPRYIDAHNHLGDARFGGHESLLAQSCLEHGIVAAVVNGTAPDDWPRVLELARLHPWIVPSFGVHPWSINNLQKGWEESLVSYLEEIPSAIGEAGLDGWKREFDRTQQEDIFIRQLAIASERNLPISIHGLRRWGRVLELLKANRRPDCGFLLHSYSGPIELIPAFADLGGYFSCPGFFLAKERSIKLGVFKGVPIERLLIETDAPDQNLPADLDRHYLRSSIDDNRINHPANIVNVYAGIASFLKISIAQLSIRIELNFNSLFGGIINSRRERPIFDSSD